MDVEISFPVESRYDFDLFAVVFPVVVNGERWNIRMPKDQLGDHFGDVPQPKLIAHFERHRGEIQAVAEKLIRKGVQGDFLLTQELWPSKP